MSPLKVLTRGYAMVQSAKGDVVRSVHQVAQADTVRIRFEDGNVWAEIRNKEEDIL